MGSSRPLLRRPDRGFATPDHYVLSNSRSVQDIPDPHHRRLVEQIRENTAESGVTLFDLGDERQGIAHVVGPEQGVTQPGLQRPIERFFRFPLMLGLRLRHAEIIQGSGVERLFAGTFLE